MMRQTIATGRRRQVARRAGYRQAEKQRSGDNPDVQKDSREASLMARKPHKYANAAGVI